ncbi:hypothetical protein MWU75_14465 [Ornithinimicrobium sp. F0845]|uniref:hypothetical protein n=1 Tax=Ornithinimicrobium sp. F0845 TaxID=2926412 RepID=UPI001FF66DCB|nr:hypothetical protein [Ornithinimicrobium sp. F0845]MCK0113350.1 hypothetical protein [Ornithinimicrobium sp. F0845]
MATAETTTYRTLPARITGTAIVVAALVLAAVMGAIEGNLGNNPLSPIAFMGVIAAIAWVLLLRPRVVLGPDRVELRNLVTDVVVPFSRLASVERKWALELVDNAGTKHSSWAIPIRRELRPRKDIDSYAEATTRGKTAEGNNAEVISGHVEREVQRWKLAGGVDEPGEGAHRTWARSAILPLLVSVVFLVVVLTFG